MAKISKQDIEHLKRVIDDFHEFQRRMNALYEVYDKKTGEVKCVIKGSLEAEMLCWEGTSTWNTRRNGLAYREVTSKAAKLLYGK